MSVYFASFLVGKQDPYEYRCEHYERVANETTKRHMRSLLTYTHYLLSAFFHYTTRISIRMLSNLYKRLTITTNVLPLIRMACELRLYMF